jgi:hypothetical protein
MVLRKKINGKAVDQRWVPAKSETNAKYVEI